MDTPLSPRDIQTRIRTGESLADVVAGSGMDAERIERFAAPVLAEREHLALTALGSSVRRRGEASGHRPLRSVVAERLLGQGVDADDVRWDAWKRDDNQWQLSADYELQGESRHAQFRFDPQGRFSVAEDDDARWLAGEAPSPVAASIDRDDELALVRATHEPSAADPQDEADDPQDEADEDEADEDGADSDGAGSAETQELVRAIAEELGAVLEVVPPVELSAEELAELAADDPESDEAGQDRAPTSGDEPTLVEVRDEAAEPTIAVVRHLARLTVEVDAVEVGPREAGTVPAGAGSPDAHLTDPAEAEARSALDTLYAMLGGHAEESPRAYAGLSDAAAVPTVDEHEFEAAADVLVPAEPDPETLEPDHADSADGADSLENTGEGSVENNTENDAADDRPAETAGAAAEDDEPEPLIPSPGASRKPGRRKRASVPTWDEIMFGGPKPG